MNPQEDGVRPPLTADDLVPDRALTKDDKDAFSYDVIASKVADLVAVGEPPLNIALFGPWGSGKSSLYELLRRALAEKKRSQIGLLSYDAWKFGGDSLQRNFITHVARKFKIPDTDENRQFYRGLYENQRTADIDFGRLEKPLKTVGLFALVFLGFAISFALLSGALSLATDENFFGQIARTLPQFLAPAAVAAVIVGAAQLILDGTRIGVEQAAPSADEEFSRTFEKLVEKVLNDNDFTRLVFFIDELDRCSADDVVETLTAIKTFLDQDECVFIVAADREVLEKALKKLPQQTPVNEDAPYYSSASSFLDKVFQHQIALPPLRGSRLTRFARDLVKDAGGVWKELREAEEGLLDQLIYVLIPSHVRSPRRIKVLLNNFATNARIAQSRNVEWPKRAKEIAKLTVLETEFPLFAADLHLEPRLPAFFLDPPVGPPDRVRRLLERHGVTLPEPPPPPPEEGDEG